MYANYTKKIGKKNAIEPRLGFFSYKSGEPIFGEWNITYTNIGCTYNMLPKGELKGFSWGPRIDIYMVSAKYTCQILSIAENVTGTSFGVGLEVTQRWITEDGFVIELGAVAAATIGGEVKSSSGISAPVASSIGFSPTFNLGWVF